MRNLMILQCALPTSEDTQAPIDVRVKRLGVFNMYSISIIHHVRATLTARYWTVLTLKDLVPGDDAKRGDVALPMKDAVQISVEGVPGVTRCYSFVIHPFVGNRGALWWPSASVRNSPPEYR